MNVWLWVIPIVALIAVGIVSAHRIRARKFADRQDVAFEEIYSGNFQSLGVPRDVADELWSEAARTLRIQPTKLRPSDRFDGELNYHLPWLPFVDLNDDFYWAAVARLKRLKADKTLFENAKTLGEYIVTFGRLEAAARGV
jgi:hypothetical protein